MNKVEAERVHAKRRAKERFGLNLTKDVRDLLRGKIKRGEGTFISRRSRRISIWRISYENIFYRVVYDKDRHEIVTFLPEEN